MMNKNQKINNNLIKMSRMINKILIMDKKEKIKYKLNYICFRIKKKKMIKNKNRKRKNKKKNNQNKNKVNRKIKRMIPTVKKINKNWSKEIMNKSKMISFKKS